MGKWLVKMGLALQAAWDIFVLWYNRQVEKLKIGDKRCC